MRAFQDVFSCNFDRDEKVAEKCLTSISCGAIITPIKRQGSRGRSLFVCGFLVFKEYMGDKEVARAVVFHAAARVSLPLDFYFKEKEHDKRN
ncbi:MAG: hypothetical protein EGQ82_05860 [Clostridiales bacterium]|nr:hypothetical protein [Clostridiales bacterium]MBD8959975.1 hypothetical protein [Clostridiales bacterium]